MKFRLFFIATALLLNLFLFGCDMQPNDPILTSTTEQSLAKDVPEVVDEPYVHEDFIYYVLPDKTVARAHIDYPNEMEVIITTAQLEAIVPYGDLYSPSGVYGDLLVFKDSGTSNFAYNLKTGEIFVLLADYSSMAVLDDMLYFVDHADRTFSLYRKPLYQPDAQPELLLGKGSTWEKGVDSTDDEPRIRSVCVEDSRIFFTQNDDELWEFKENGKHVRVD